MTASTLAADPVTFASLGVPPALVAALSAQRIREPFPIQAATIPDALAGRDVCGRAPTGSGKTIAFGIPLVTRVPDARPRRPTGLVLVPTRELAAQVCAELRLLAGRSGPRVEAVYGGVGFDAQRRALRRGVEVLVACPGRLADLLAQDELRLDEVRVAVLDEADRMADMGFLPEVRRILDRCPTDRQTLLFSATLDGDVDVLVERYQEHPVRHDHGDDDEAALADVEHHFWIAERPDRVAVAVDVIRTSGPTVVFSRTRRGADRLARQLDQRGIRTAVIHGDRSQGQRERALDAFHRGTADALVATDVAARGIHVDGVACVLHFDVAGDAKDYVHRSGRTGRAGARGVVVSLVHREARAAARALQRELDLEQAVTPVDLTRLGEPQDVRAPSREASRPGRSAPASGRGRHAPAPAEGRRGSRGRRRGGPDTTRRDPATGARGSATTARGRSAGSAAATPSRRPAKASRSAGSGNRKPAQAAGGRGGRRPPRRRS